MWGKMERASEREEKEEMQRREGGEVRGDEGRRAKPKAGRRGAAMKSYTSIYIYYIKNSFLPLLIKIR